MEVCVGKKLYRCVCLILWLGCVHPAYGTQCRAHVLPWRATGRDVAMLEQGLA